MTKHFCVHCGQEIKKKHVLAKCECFSCRSAKEYLKKGDHCSSTKQVKALKKIDSEGLNFVQRIFSD